MYYKISDQELDVPLILDFGPPMSIRVRVVSVASSDMRQLFYEHVVYQWPPHGRADAEMTTCCHTVFPAVLSNPLGMYQLLNRHLSLLVDRHFPQFPYYSSPFRILKEVYVLFRRMNKAEPARARILQQALQLLVLVHIARDPKVELLDANAQRILSSGLPGGTEVLFAPLISANAVNENLRGIARPSRVVPMYSTTIDWDSQATIVPSPHQVAARNALTPQFLGDDYDASLWDSDIWSIADDDTFLDDTDMSVLAPAYAAVAPGFYWSSSFDYPKLGWWISTNNSKFDTETQEHPETSNDPSNDGPKAFTGSGIDIVAITSLIFVPLDKYLETGGRASDAYAKLNEEVEQLRATIEALRASNECRDQEMLEALFPPARVKMLRMLLELVATLMRRQQNKPFWYVRKLSKG
ncbi:hypothetical protein H2199_009133 [Coniosporium tulheliwenetii]|uniref:Uncharacterized protein n=1 Tax=Coniosporium tulheliwenetii TaxID=3383036 RepID=A0ACC2YFS3_9PEZI|nr:hypothetical protein H2199_009133 [Cladosporium sp. JES 115]